MQMFPRTKDKWIALAFFPFKAFIVIAFPFYYLAHLYFSVVLKWRHYDLGYIKHPLIQGCSICAGALLFATVVFFYLGRDDDAFSAVCFFAAGILGGILFLS